MRRAGEPAERVTERITAAIDGVFSDPSPDASGFAWADVLRSGAAWAAKTRSGDRWKFDMVEQHLARQAGQANGRAPPVSRARAAMDAIKARRAAGGDDGKLG